MTDFSFTAPELQVMMSSMLLFRELVEEELDEIEPDAPGRDTAIDQNELSNSVIRKLKSIMEENGIEIPEP